MNPVNPLQQPIDPLLLLSVAADLVGVHPEYGEGVAALISHLFDAPETPPEEVLAVLAGIRSE